MHRTAPWLGLSAVTAATGWALGRAGLPSAYLFAALLLGIAVALARPERLAIASGWLSAAQAVTGVTLGAYLQRSALGELADQWLPVTLVSAATLALTLAAGAVLTRVTEADAPTAALGMVAGGASGIVGMSRELGGDDRLVAFMQYARVLVIVFATPILVAVAFPGDHGGAATLPGSGGGGLGDARGWALTAAVAVAGGALGVLARLPAASLLGPLALGAALTLGGTSFAVPPLLQETAFAVIGLQVGLRFTMDTVRGAGRLLVPVLVSIAALLAGCFGLAVALDATTSVSLLDAYLATTPGGLYAVLATAVGAGADTTFIVAVQGLRLLIMVLLAPLAVRVLVRGARGRPG